MAAADSARNFRNNPAFSILVPVYNTPKSLLERAASSVLNQDFDSFELLFVDDGGLPQTAEYLDEIASSDHRITVIHSEHGGVSNARNIGLKNVKGDYVVFLDSDDELRNDCLRILYSAFEHSVDVVYCGLVWVYKNNVRVKRAASEPSFFVLSADEAAALPSKLLASVTDSSNNRISSVFGGMAGTAIKRSIAEQICFDTHITYGEDLLYNIRSLMMAKTIGVEPTPLYLYYQYGTSLSHNQSGDDLPKLISETLKCLQALRDSGIRLGAMAEGLRMLTSILAFTEIYSVGNTAKDCAELLKSVCSHEDVRKTLAPVRASFSKSKLVMTRYRNLSFNSILNGHYYLTYLLVRIKSFLHSHDALIDLGSLESE